MQSENTDTDEYFLDEDVSQENEEDVGGLSSEAIRQAVVSATDWTAETILTQLKKGSIILNPSFQRRDAWTPEKKSAFIESLIMGFPTPQIVLAESRDRRGSYIVLDGKQRLLSIRQFAAEPGETEYEPLQLRGLKLRPDLNRKSLHELRSDFAFGDEVAEFENQTIRTVVIKNWPNDDFLFHVFLRLNTGSVKLSPQELRQALSPGPFIDYADAASFNSFAVKDLLNLKKPDFRMRDVELLIRYLAFKNFSLMYSGSMKKFLDDTCETLNDQWDDYEEEIKSQAGELDEAYKFCVLVFGDGNVARKWTRGKYQRQLNRALFDILMYFFSDPAVRQAARGYEKSVEKQFQTLCESDRDFISSIERTTKSLDSTATRFSKWANSLNEILPISLPVAEIKNKKLFM